MKHQLAEIFHSYQGEGAYVGKPMMFIRFAGCSVGKYGSLGQDKPAMCTAWSGHGFECDTDYRKHFTLGTEEILKCCKYDTICLTGGEPLDRDLEELVDRAHELSLRVHVETSGTVYKTWVEKVDWLVVSPKIKVLDQMLKLCHELRMVYDLSWWSASFDSTQRRMRDMVACALARIKEPPYLPRPCVIYVSPINNYDSLNNDNLEGVKRLLEHNNSWRLSCQMHKLLKVR